MAISQAMINLKHNSKLFYGDAWNSIENGHWVFYPSTKAVTEAIEKSMA